MQLALRREEFAMRAWIAVAVLALAGCASSGAIRANAYAHQEKADALESQGDYAGAAKERRAAAKESAKADERAYYERTGVVL
jgi:hypothetical protein